MSGEEADLKTTLLGQFDTAWKLAHYHLDGLTDEECLWRPAAKGLHIHLDTDGVWRADWPEHEGYDIGPASIGWITWHMIFWWSSALDHNFADGTLTKDDVTWPGSADAVRGELTRLHDGWREKLSGLSNEDFASPGRARWPYRDRPFADVVAWLNMELTKNAAELGYVRFLYTVRERQI